MRSILYHAIGAALVVALATPAFAQQTAPASHSQWRPWIGCWHVSEESVDDGAELLAQLGGAQPARTITAPGTLVCVAPSADNGVTVTTTVNDRPVLTETIVADGTERPLSESGCRGWQKAEWSALGSRVYARAEITCGDQPRRTVSGLATMVSGPMWLDIQMIESEGRKSLRVRRYRRAANQQQPVALPSTMRNASDAPLGRKLSLEDIKEASSKVPAEALQAAVLELGNGGYDLKAKQLLDLDAAGVPDSVTDLMVAMSFPKRFVVERASSGGGGGGGFGSMYGDMWDPTYDMWSYFAMWPYMGMWPSYRDPFFYSTFYSPYYSPFGYGRWGSYYSDYYRYYGNSIVVIDPTVPSGGTAQPVEGRVVDGRGYTRIRRTDPAPPTRINSGDGGGWGTTSSSGGSSSSGSGSGVSSGGYSSGGGGGGGRTAVPRPPGL